MNRISFRVPALALAVAMTASLASLPATAMSGHEKCFGVAAKGKNEGIEGAAADGTAGAGASKIDHQGNAWTLLPHGACEKTPSKTSSTGFGQTRAFTEKKS